mmetsp:Transcript_35982/g.63105  ORF Transcript_35982/g.63105 Transcript_35982/m.63105 type:complete len:85 (-) Transcript_35982:46-300(-)
MVESSLDLDPRRQGHFPISLFVRWPNGREEYVSLDGWTSPPSSGSHSRLYGFLESHTAAQYYDLHFRALILVIAAPLVILCKES